METWKLGNPTSADFTNPTSFYSQKQLQLALKRRNIVVRNLSTVLPKYIIGIKGERVSIFHLEEDHDEMNNFIIT